MESSPRLKTVEDQANYEGNWSLLLFSRLENPKIRKQVLDTLKEANDGDYPDKEIEDTFVKSLCAVKTDTPISFEDAAPGVGFTGREILPLGFVSKRTRDAKKPTAKIWNIIESHEKGHIIRRGYFKTLKKMGIL